MSANTMRRAGAVPAVVPGTPPNGILPGSPPRTSPRTSPDGISAPEGRYLRFTPLTRAAAAVPDRDIPADVIELYPGRQLKRATIRRWKIRSLKRSYSGQGRSLAADAGMATAEYAIATLAAVSFAGVLVFLLRSEEVRAFLLNVIRTALTLP